MTDRDLDALVAEKVMGREVIRRPYSNEGPCLRALDSRQWVPMPNYSTDIAAAWEVADEVMKRKPWDNGFRLETHCENSEEKWLCFFPKITSAPPYEEMNPEANEAEADTAPRAICLASLNTVGYKMKEAA